MSFRSFTPFYYELDFVNTIADGGSRAEIKMHRPETVMSQMLINTTFNALALKIDAALMTPDRKYQPEYFSAY